MNLEEQLALKPLASGKAGNPKNRPKMLYRKGMYDLAGKSFCQRLRELGCPDTLIKDVRDVAAAVMNSEGPGRVEEEGLNRLKSPGHLKQKPR